MNTRLQKFQIWNTIFPNKVLFQNYLCSNLFHQFVKLIFETKNMFIKSEHMHNKKSGVSNLFETIFLDTITTNKIKIQEQNKEPKKSMC